MSESYPEPIAIVGLACRLPGDISSPSELWGFLSQEKSAQSDFPKNRLNIDSWYNADGQKPGSIFTKGGYFLSDNESFKEFDPSFFGISPLEAKSMDPQQRKLLEVVYESFESAGLGLQDVSGSKTGCFVGNFTWDIGQMQARDVDFGAPYQMTGGGLTILSNRVNYTFNLKGPSLTVDTACSSTMYALHLACRSLLSGDCSAAVVGGTNLVFGIEQQIGSVRLGTLSPTSICHTFDESADGYARAEAIGAIYIKRLSDAIRDGDPIRSVIRATSINTNGRGAGISHPSSADQEAVIRKAYSNAGLTYENTGYFESHGTGTPVGDPIEFSAIGNVFGPLRSQDNPLLIGSIKTNLGHSEAASSIPSLIKTVLSLEHGMIPATIGIKKFNPALNFHNGALQVVQSLTNWPSKHAYRRASVNSFGYGGANAHTILDATQSYLEKALSTFIHIPHPATSSQASEPSTNGLSAPPVDVEHHVNGDHINGDHINGNHINGNHMNGTRTNGSLAGADVSNGEHAPHKPSTKTYLLPFSAHDRTTLDTNIDVISKSSAKASMLDLAYTLSKARGSLSTKAYSITSRLVNEEVGALNLDNVTYSNATPQKPTMAFIFTGQGAQWPRMGMTLVEEYPSFHQNLVQMDKILASLPQAPEWTILDTLAESKSSSKINDAERSQTVCTALQVALVELLRSWNIMPRAVVGHSSGEIAAAFAAGYLTVQEAITAAYVRGYAVSRNNIPGSMLAVGIGANDVQQLISGMSEIAIACQNSPVSVTLSGTEAAIDEAHGVFTRAGLFSRKLLTGGNAYHSWLMKPAAVEYEEQLLKLLPGDNETTRGAGHASMFSSVTGKAVTSTLQRQYWRENLESPVIFDQALSELLRSLPEINYAVEIGPHSALAGPVKEIRTSIGRDDLEYIPALKRNLNGVDNVLTLAGRLFLANHPVDLVKINSNQTVVVDGNGATKSVTYNSGALIVDLPRYQWNYEGLHWSESRLSTDIRFRKWPYHDLLGSLLPGSSKSSPSWRNIIRLENIPWIKDHKVGEDIVFPAAGYISLAITAATQATELFAQKPTCSLRNVKIKSAMVLKENVDLEYMVDLQSASADYKEFNFTVSSVVAGVWETHASGNIQVSEEKKALSRTVSSSGLRVIRKGINQATQDRRWYQKMSNIGLKYGPAFQTLSNIQATSDESTAISDVRMNTDATGKHESWYLVHPLAIDACLQLSIIAAHKGDPQNLIKSYLPVDIDHMTISGGVSGIDADKSVIHGRGCRRGLRAIDTALDLVNDNGEAFLTAKLTFLSLESSINSQQESRTPQPYSRLVWKPDINHLSSEQFATLCSGLRSSDQEVSRTKDIDDRVTILMDLIVHDDPHVNILEVGCGNSGPSKNLLSVLRGHDQIPNYVKYVFCHADVDHLKSIEQNHQEYFNLEFSELAIDSSEVSQTFNELKGSFDIIIASDILLRSETVTHALENCCQLLKSGGRLIVVENQADQGQSSSSSLEAEANQRLSSAGFSHANIFSRSVIPSTATLSSVVMSSKVSESAHALPLSNGATNGITNGTEDTAVQGSHEKPILLFYRNEPHKLLAELENIYAAQGIETRAMKFTDFPSSGHSDARTIMLVELEEPLLSRMSELDMDTMRRYTQLASSSIWVTNSNVLVGYEPEKALVFGIAKSVMTEQPSFRLGSIDIDDSTQNLTHAAQLVASMEQRFYRNNGPMNTELVEKDEIVYISRYIGDDQGNAEFAQNWKPASAVKPLRDDLLLAFEKIGRLESFYFKHNGGSSKDVSATEVIVKPRAFAFDNAALSTMKGQTNRPFYTLECGGVVASVGSRVQRFKSGDVVVCLKPNWLDTTLAVDEEFVFPVKDENEVNGIVSQVLPYTFATYSLQNTCHITEHDKVLIDVSSTAQATALVRVALRAGSQVYALSYSEEQTHALQAIPGAEVVNAQSVPEDVPSNIVLTNGTLDLNALRIKSVNNRSHLVLLPGQVSLASAATLMPLFKKGLTVTFLDPLDIMSSDASGMSLAFQTAMEQVQNGLIPQLAFSPVDFSQFPQQVMSELQSSDSRVVVTLDTEKTLVPIRHIPEPLTFDGNNSYLLIGCLGGLGRSLTTWMIARGAKNFIFLSRSGADKPEAAALVADLEEMSKSQNYGLSIQVVRGDVTKREDIANAIAHAKTPIKGVIQGAMVLHELIFSTMSLRQWNQVIHPKVQGTIYLHQLLQHEDVDFFVMCSSVLGAIGAATQSNYSAGNAFLDAMARHRHSLGLQATSIALGMILEVGHVEEHPEVETALKRNGMYGIGVTEFLLSMEAACRRRHLPQKPSWDYDQAASSHIVTGMDPTRVTQAGGKGMWLSDLRLRHLLLAIGNEGDANKSRASGEESIAVSLKAAEKDGAKSLQVLVQKLLMERLSKLVLLPVENMSAHQPLSMYGMDSMISAELRSWAWKELKADIPFMTLQDQTLDFERLSEQIVQSMQLDLLG